LGFTDMFSAFLLFRFRDKPTTGYIALEMRLLATATATGLSDSASQSVVGQKGSSWPDSC
jgi:hypothetical protein